MTLRDNKYTVSIVIPVRDNSEGTSKLLNALRDQDHNYLVHVIIVENGSKSFLPPTDYPVRLSYFQLPVASRSAARNYGASKAESTHIAFLDSDVIPQPEWLKRLMDRMKDETLAIQSEVVPDGAVDGRIHYIRYLRAFIRNNKSFLSLNRIPEEQKFINSAAFIVRADVFHRIGGFDESLVRHEDVDFSKRIFMEEGKIVGVREYGCSVYFDGGIVKYLLREVNCGFHIVGFHNRWGKGGFLRGSYRMFVNFLMWPINCIIPPFSLVKFEMQIIGLCYLVGNLGGLICYDWRRIERPREYVKRSEIIIL